MSAVDHRKSRLRAGRTGHRWYSLRSVAKCMVLLLMTLFGAMGEARGQTIQTQADSVITIQRGSSAILTVPDTLLRVSVADPEVAEAVVIPPRQLVVNAISVGSTSLILWGRNETSQLFTVEITADLASLERQLRDFFPEADLEISSTGTTVSTRLSRFRFMKSAEPK